MGVASGVLQHRQNLVTTDAHDGNTKGFHTTRPYSSPPQIPGFTRLNVLIIRITETCEMLLVIGCLYTVNSMASKDS